MGGVPAGRQTAFDTEVTEAGTEVAENGLGDLCVQCAFTNGSPR